MENQKNGHAERACFYCGTLFIPTRKNNVFCCKRCATNSSKENRGIKPTTVYKKICLGCGKEFETVYSLKTYCSKGCNWKTRHKVGATPRIINCAICGTEFETKNPLQFTCGKRECQLEQHKRRNAKNKKAPRLITYETRECAECGELFFVDDKLNNVYCSKECRKKAENRKHDRRIPKNQKVDNITLGKLFKRDNGKCYICGCLCDYNSISISQKGNEYPGDLYPTVEHIIPISKGGLHSWDNVRLACWKCNLAKGDAIIQSEPMSKEFAYSQKAAQAKRTAQYSLDGNLIRVWESTAQIERELGLNSKHIQNVCRGDKSKTGNAYGFHWEYIE